MRLQCGDCFLIPKSGGATEHLWIVVTEIDTRTRKAICVNVTTLRTHSDTTCILKPGDHPFVKHDPVINFSGAREMPIDLVEQALDAKTSPAVQRSPASRIRRGLVNSKQTPKGIRAICKDQFGFE